MSDSSDIKTIKCVTIGDGAVGKTCMLISFSQDRFPDEYVPTVFDNYTVDMEFNSKQYKLNLWDTAGQHDYDDVRSLAFVDTHVFVLCYSFDDRDSFDNIADKWSKDVAKYMEKAGKTIPIILVGCKADLREEGNVEAVNIKKSEQEKVAKDINAYAQLECSAMTQKGLKTVFETALKAGVESSKQKSKSNFDEKDEEKSGCGGCNIL